MGGRGPGHKSERARAARLKNIQKARAARKRAPLPWRSGLESRIIEQLVWQWWCSSEPGKWPAYRVARFLGVSHTWVAKLVKRFKSDPDRARRRMRAFAPADFEKLERARRETRWQREHGWLRGPIRSRKVTYTQDQKRKAVVLPTQSQARRAAKGGPPPAVPGLPEALALSTGQLPRELWPPWASGSVPSEIPSAHEIQTKNLSGSSTFPAPSLQPPASRKGPVPFAFRRRRR